MDVEKLIEGVKKRPILYESTKKAYKDAARRDDAWKEVGEEEGEGVTGLYCESSKSSKIKKKVTAAITTSATAYSASSLLYLHIINIPMHVICRATTDNNGRRRPLSHRG